MKVLESVTSNIKRDLNYTNKDLIYYLNFIRTICDGVGWEESPQYVLDLFIFDSLRIIL